MLLFAINPIRQFAIETDPHRSISRTGVTFNIAKDNNISSVDRQTNQTMPYWNSFHEHRF